MNGTLSAVDDSSYAYEDSNTLEDDKVLVDVADREHMEKDLWTELDIDEDRDEPIFKVVVLLITVGVAAWFVRTHCCHTYKALPRDGHDALQADLGFAPRMSTTEDEGFTLDVFSLLARKLQL